MKRFLRDNGLSIAMFVLFGVFLIGQILTGWISNNQEQVLQKQATLSLLQYLTSGAFFEATFENWESEFLQMGAFVLLSAILIQRGSPESKKPDEPDESREHVERAARLRGLSSAGGAVYAHSLSIALFLLFAVSFLIHAVGGMKDYNDELANYGLPSVGLGQFLVSSRFWFQSLQNWQSEFLSVGTLLVLSIYLREKGSSQSKKVDAPNAQTGSD